MAEAEGIMKAKPSRMGTLDKTDTNYKITDPNERQRILEHNVSLMRSRGVDDWTIAVTLGLSEGTARSLGLDVEFVKNPYA